LKASAPLKNDVIFLFTDGEEMGLLGAEAFVAEHPSVRDVGLVLNFEARGTCGPVYMFETSERNGALVAEFAKAAPRPYASSLAYTVYKLLPNDTDLTVFKGAGMAGLNFAYVGCSANYHRPADSVSNLDADSLRHMGSYAPALARHFADGPLDFSGAGRAVYFDLFGLALVHYSQTWVTPLAVGAALLFALVLFYGFRKKLLTWRGTALGFFGLLAAAACALALSAAFKSLTAGARGRVELLALALAVLTLLVAVGVYALLLRRAGVASLCAGALLWWLVPAVGVSRDFPGASYLYLWPLLCGTLALALLLWAEARRLHPFALLSALCLLLLPPVALLARTADGLVQALGLRMPFVLVALVLTGSALLVPFLTFAPRARRAHTPPHTDS
ncbi:MAG TPA: M28 family peptidase, partial [Pyrinomonadaceae bacterium]|nr:M28 family peptidase [Pyrinomonadaceae bacterium]